MDTSRLRPIARKVRRRARRLAALAPRTGSSPTPPLSPAPTPPAAAVTAPPPRRPGHHGPTQPATVVAAARQHGRALDLSRCAYGPATGGRFLGSPRNYYGFLGGLAQVTRARTVLEIGTHFGGSAVAMAIGQAAAGLTPHVVTLDIDDHAGETVRNEPGVERIIGDLRDPEIFERVRAATGGSVDLVYIDALKDEDFLLETMAAVAPLSAGWTVLDDIGATASIARGWRRLARTHAGYTTTVDAVAVDIRERPYGQGVIATDAALTALRDDLGATTVRAVWGGVVAAGAYGNEAEVDALPVPAMMRPRERALVHRAVRDLWTGGGEIVDAGAFLGASTTAFAAGLAARADAGRQFRRIHSYDLFLKTNASHDAHIDEQVERNASFEHLYHRNLGDLARHVNVYAGDFASMRWIGQPIEIFFADVAKSPALDAHVYGEFAPFWVPGSTLYLQQDFVHAEAPWVQVSIGALLDHFEILGVEAPTLALGLASPLDPDLFARVVAHDFSTDEQVAHVLRLYDAIDHDETRGTMLLVAARIQHAAGRPKRANGLLNRCVAEFGELTDPNFVKRIRATRRKLAT